MFCVPVEIIFPNFEEGYYNCAELAFEISDVHNNNPPLTAGTKADHRGHYKELKNIDPLIKENHFDPVKVGKSPVAYSGCEMALKMMLIKQ